MLWRRGYRAWMEEVLLSAPFWRKLPIFFGRCASLLFFGGFGLRGMRDFLEALRGLRGSYGWC